MRAWSSERKACERGALKYVYFLKFLKKAHLVSNDFEFIFN